MKISCQPIGEEIFSAQNIRQCEEYVLSMQRKLDKAVANEDVERIRWYTHLLSKRSRAVLIVAINKVTRLNGGKYTAGCDGMKTPKEKVRADKMRLELINQININKKPRPIRRVFIPKPNGKKRPLGIATIADRVVQEIIRITIEPIAEYHFSSNSYGYRPKRSCHDAITHIYLCIGSHKRPTRYIVEGDISGCFDHISHNHILSSMKKWGISDSINKIVAKMLKAKILSQETLEDSYEGTPQGSILSPMLANIALTTLDEFGETLKKNRANPIIRYADDFVILCDTLEEAIEMKQKVSVLLKERIGVDLSDEKTRITHLDDGFQFLGFDIRKYRQKRPKSKYHQVGKLLIKPQKQKVQKFLYECKKVINSAKGQNLEHLLRELNPKIRGFANYYRFVVSGVTFHRISHDLWHKVYRWLCKSHPNKTKGWVWERYVIPYNEYQQTKTIGQKGTNLQLMQFVPIKRYTMIKKGIRRYDNSQSNRKYWVRRAYHNSLNSIYSVKISKLFKRQTGLCPICRKPITGEQIRGNEIHTHHMFPSSIIVDNKLGNLRLVHKNCHWDLHRILSVEEMQKLAEADTDYCHKNYLY